MSACVYVCVCSRRSECGGASSLLDVQAPLSEIRVSMCGVHVLRGAGNIVEEEWGDSLHPDWEEFETEDGDIYYYNASTDESTWERPAAPKRSRSKTTGARPPGVGGGGRQ